MPLKKSLKQIPLQTIKRMSLYRRILEELHGKGVGNVYSYQLAKMAHVNPALLRRDLASFGSFGNIAKGYSVHQMILTINRLFGTDKLQNVALVGVGNLGKTLLAHRGFEARGFHIALIFDIDEGKVGQVFFGRRCYHIGDLDALLPDYSITTAILACGEQNLTALVDRLAKAGIRGILNFVPKQVYGTEGINVDNVDFAARLERLSFLSLNRSGIVY